MGGRDRAAGDVGEALRAAFTGGRLTAAPAKEEIFGHEPFAREAFVTLHAHLGDSAVDWLHAHAVVVLRPDLIASRGVEEVVRFLADHELAVRWHGQVHLSRLAIETIWRYQWNVATADRHALAEQIYGYSPSLLLLLEDESADRQIPASVRLAHLKGPCQPELQDRGHLRRALGAPSRMMSLVHSPDEPVDVLRELGILFDRSEIDAVSRGWVSRRPSRSLADEVACLYAATEASSLDHDAAMGRLAELAGDDAMAMIRSAIGEYTGRSCDPEVQLAGGWRDVAELIDRHAAPLAGWDRLTIWAQYVAHELANATYLIDDDGLAGWATDPDARRRLASVGG
jgi:hypothetical protein